jgi:DNA helicase-2/ATP-dependent DNA helicase PcrA
MEVADRRYGEKSTTLRLLLHERANEAPRDLFSKGLHQGMKNASASIESLIAEVPNITLQQLFEKIIRETGLLKTSCSRPTNTGSYRYSPASSIL